MQSCKNVICLSQSLQIRVLNNAVQAVTLVMKNNIQRSGAFALTYRSPKRSESRGKPFKWLSGHLSRSCPN